MSVELEVVRENLARRTRGDRRGGAALGPRAPSAVELLAAVKYVAPEDMATLAAGRHRARRREPRRAAAGQAGRRTATRFTWDFIGAPAEPQGARPGRARAARALALDARRPPSARSQQRDAAWRACVEVNVAGEDSKEGLAPAALDEFLEAVAPLGHIRVEGLMTMPPLADGRGGVAAVRSRRCASWPRASASAGRRRHALRPPLDGHEPGLRRRRGGGRDDRAPRIDPLPPVERIVSPLMGLGDVWYKTKVYFGLAEDDDLYDDDEDGALAEEDLEQRYRRRPNVRPLDAPPRARRGARRRHLLRGRRRRPAAVAACATRAARRRCCARPSRSAPRTSPRST